MTPTHTKGPAATRNGVRVRKARQSHGGKGFVAGYYVAGTVVAFSWGPTREEARLAVLAEAEEMGLVTDGVDDV